jgi:hypothetical protein
MPHHGITPPGAERCYKPSSFCPTETRAARHCRASAERRQYYGGSSAYTTGQFTLPAALAANSFALAGDWSIGQQSITAGSGAGIRLAFHTADVYLDVSGTGTGTLLHGNLAIEPWGRTTVRSEE